MGFTIAQLLFRPVFSIFARAMIPKKPRWSHNVWGAKVIRCCDSVFKCAYYLVMTIWCFALLRDEPWLPSVLGGSGDTRHCWTNRSALEAVKPGLRHFYLTAVGYYLSETGMLIAETRKPDFWEMLLHHVCSCSLVTFSYILNYTRIGSLALLLHGGTDVLIYASKVLVDTSCIRATAVSYLALILSYGWLRIYIFPVYIMRSAWIESVAEVESQNSLFGWGFLNFALCLLLVLHIYWFGLIVKMGCVWRKTGQARDIQANLSAMDILDKKST